MTTFMLRHALLLLIGVLAISALPPLISGLPMNQLLSSDAEFYTHSMRLLHQGVSAAESGIPMDTKPIGDKLLNQFIGSVSDAFSIDLPLLSIVISIVVYFLFILGVYATSLVALDSSRWAFFIAAFSLLPVHVLGGTTFGVYPMGFLPRDLGLAMALGILALYLRAEQQDNEKRRRLTYILCGLSANYYSICFVHLCAVLILAEIVGRRKLTKDIFLHALLWIVAATPALYDLFAKTGTWAPVDIAIMRLRNSWMIASLDDWLSTVRYLRRFVVHGALTGIGAYLVSRWGTTAVKHRLNPVIRVALVSFGIAVIAIFVEATTEYLRFFFSRTSLFLTLTSMIVFIAGLKAFGDARQIKKASWGIALLCSGIFVFQSNIVSMARYFQGLAVTAPEKKRFFAAVEKTKEVTPTNATILVPSPEMDDIAATLRTYAERKIFVSYKDGGVSLVDGARARDWLRRLRAQEKILASEDPYQLIALMRSENVTHAFLPENLPMAQKIVDIPQLSLVLSSPGYRLYQLKN